MTTRAPDTLWIFRLDGTIQCDPDAREIPLEEMRKELETLIGAQNVVDMEKRFLVMIALCGVPTGRANAYRVTREGWDLLQNGIAGNPGFAPWPGEEAGAARATSSATADGTKTVEDLIGLRLRAYTTGDGLTDDFRTDRVNIESGSDRKIVRVWFG